MAADEQAEEVAAPSTRGAPRSAPRRPRSDGEKGLALEVARLFGMSPRVLLHRDTASQVPGPDESTTGEGDDKAPADEG